MESHYIKIFTGNFILVQRITAKLEEVGISAVVKDESESGRLAGFGAPVQGQQEVFVHEDELNKATPIVQSALAEMEV